eukprot:189382-Chlamydomonas_euryale.AAC.1
MARAHTHSLPRGVARAPLARAFDKHRKPMEKKCARAPAGTPASGETGVVGLHLRKRVRESERERACTGKSHTHEPRWDALHRGNTECCAVQRCERVVPHLQVLDVRLDLRRLPTRPLRKERRKPAGRLAWEAGDAEGFDGGRRALAYVRVGA